ncbi:MAG: bifunctional precorrin-2 dehydrogenase/sirohydrochlorin ferrochelatase [Candidatus Latescibacterota bacterium]
MEDCDLYPLFLKLHGKRCLVVGGGVVAYRKICDLLECGADVLMVAEKPIQECYTIAEKGEIKLLQRSFQQDDIKDMFLVFAATDDKEVNAEIAYLARREGILVNAVDDPAKCDFLSGSIVKRGPLKIAISTSGYSPLIAHKIRCELEERYDETYGDFIHSVGEMRKIILSSDCVDEKKKLSLDWLSGEHAFTLFKTSGKDIVWEEVEKILYS